MRQSRIKHQHTIIKFENGRRPISMKKAAVDGMTLHALSQKQEIIIIAENRAAILSGGERAFFKITRRPFGTIGTAEERCKADKHWKTNFLQDSVQRSPPTQGLGAE